MLVDKDIKNDMTKWEVTDHVLGLKSSIIREILKFSSQPGVISFAGGLPAAELFPIETMKKIADDVLTKYGKEALQYTITKGIIPLRELLAKRATSQGITSTQDNILITSGSQQGIELVARAFIEPNDYILTEDPTYVGALQAFNYYQTKYAAIEMDSDGIIIEDVEKKINEYHPKFIYTISNFQNPTGITMSLSRRNKLIEIAAKYNLPVIDDNPYGDIRFSGEALPSLKSIGGDSVIDLRTFSKTLAPGFRIGWINGPADMINIFEKVKQCTDLHTSTFGQYMVCEFLSQGLLEPHIEIIKKDYLVKRNTMINALKEYFPEGIKWTEPDGGLFLWVELPEHMSSKDLLQKAVEMKVAYVYGSPFFPNGKGENTLRMNFSTASKEDIVEGVKRLAKLFKENM